MFLISYFSQFILNKKSPESFLSYSCPVYHKPSTPSRAQQWSGSDHQTLEVMSWGDAAQTPGLPHDP